MELGTRVTQITLAGRTLAVLLFLGIALTACSKKEEARGRPAPARSQDALQREAEAIVDRELKKMEKKEAATFPCGVFKTDEVAAIVGGPVRPGAYTFNHIDENGRKFRAASCSWSSADAGGGAVDVWVSRSGQFDSGKVECYPPIGRSGAGNMDGIGTAAYWEFNKFYGVGTVRACSEKALVEVRVEKKGADERTVQGMVRKVAERVLAGSG